MGRLLLVRHAQSEWNAQRRSQGWCDPPLTEAGARAAAHAAGLLAELSPTVVACSDLRRAVQSAEPLVGRLGVAPLLDARLREREMGWWSGATEEEIEARWPGALAEFRLGARDRAPGGESTRSLLARVDAALARVAAVGGGGDGVVFTHGGVLRALERRTGVATPRMGNLSARWFTFPAGGTPVAGVPLPLLD